MNIENRHALITGASGGIGWALAEEMAVRGAHLHLVARNPKTEWEQPLLDRGAKSVKVWACDIEKPEQIESLKSNLDQAGVTIDILINNAGQLTGGLVEEQNIDDIRKMLNVNLAGLIHMSQLFLKDMLKRKLGKIVNNASVSGKMFFPCASTYAASKAGVVAFTECLEQEVRGTGVSTLLLITPGVKTRMFDEIFKLYGGHMNLKWLTSIPAEDWAKQVCNSIESDANICKPSGANGVMLKLAVHSPKLFKSIVKGQFTRDLSEKKSN